MTGRIPHLRWWITGMLFISTVINYVDRQTLSILARTIQDDLGMSDLDYSYVVQAFLLAYTVMFLFAGRVTDWLGARFSLAFFITWWSLANMASALSRSPFALGVNRFLLGIGEPGNYTAATKAVSEWFPPKERGLVIGIYTAGATVGATIAPPLIALMTRAHGWRGTFVLTGALGLLWVIPWLWLYPRQQRHPRITDEERALTAPLHALQSSDIKTTEWGRWRGLLSLRETWLLLASRILTDPVWYFYLFWFPKYLSDARRLTLTEVGMIAWIVFLAADAGSILGGLASGALIKRGMSPIRSRLKVMTIAACLLPLSPLVAISSSLGFALAIASIAALAHLAWQVTLGALIVDIYPQRSVATAFGIVAAGSGLGGMISTGVVGHMVTSYSYTPVFIIMGLLHPCALLIIRQLRLNVAKMSPPAV